MIIPWHFLFLPSVNNLGLFDKIVPIKNGFWILLVGTGLLILPMKIGLLILPVGTGLLILQMKIRLLILSMGTELLILPMKIGFLILPVGTGLLMNNLSQVWIMGFDHGIESHLDKIILPWICIMGFSEYLLSIEFLGLRKD